MRCGSVGVDWGVGDSGLRVFFGEQGDDSGLNER